MKRIQMFCILLMVFFLPLTIIAAENEKQALLWYYWGKDPSLEIVEARTLNTKVFLNEDGHRTYRIYLKPVHYIDKAGYLCDIEPGDPPQNSPRDMDFAGYADELFGDVVTNDQIWTHEDGFWRGFAKFNTSAIPDTTIIDSVKLSLYALNCWAVINAETHDIRSMESNPQFGDGYSIHADAGNGVLYVNDFDPDPNTLHTWILGDEATDTACVQMTNQLSANWFAIGMCDHGGGGWYGNAMGYDRGTGYLEIEDPPTGVSLVSFSASHDFDQVIIRWQTAYEKNNLEWLLERKTEQGEYSIIAIIPGQLTKPGPTDYAYTDRDISPGMTYYYRLVNVNTDGERTYHSALAVYIPAVEGKRLFVFPSIFTQQLSIHISGVYGKNGILSIIDKTGRIIKECPITGNVSPMDVVWDGCDENGKRVTAGIYYIRLTINGNQAETEKVILIK
jgi:hypothetical protein